MSATSWPAHFSSHHAVSAWREASYLDGVRNGSFVPFTVPSVWYGSLLLLMPLLVPALQGRVPRYVVFTLHAIFQAWIILKCRARDPLISFTIGLLSSWSIIWAAVVLIIVDVKKNFKRVKQTLREPSHANTKEHFNFPDATHEDTVEGQVRQRKQQVLNGKSNGTVTSPIAQKGSAQYMSYSWQSFPANSFTERLVWAGDLLMNYRGIGWNWKITGIPQRPPSVEAPLRGVDVALLAQEDRIASSTGRRRYDTKKEFILNNVSLVVVSYVILDVLKTIINRDPYFWGLTDQPAPMYLPLIIRNSVFFTRTYRLGVSSLFLWALIRALFAIPSLIYVGILGPKILGINGEPWMYPDHFGSYGVILQRGMAGLWGGWWHQVFRYGFQSSSRWVASDLLHLGEKSPVSGVVQLCTSFYLSGLMHAAGTTTTIGDTSPWLGQFLFFALQPLWIILGLVWSHLLKRSGYSRKMPHWLGWVGNFVWVHACALLAVPLLMDDLARGGIFLTEPVPFSPLRGLGYGVAGDEFYCWTGLKNMWRTDQPWWMSGLAL